MGSGLLERVVRSEQLDGSGKSGAILERAWLDDGSTVVLKHADARHDWIMQATSDQARIATLWSDGILDRLPPSIDHAMLDVLRDGSGATIVMRDVSAHLTAVDQMPRTFHRSVLAATAQMHAAYADTPLSELCTLGAYYTFLSPGVCARFAADHDVPRLAFEGWTRFHDLVAPDVAEAIAAIHADPAPLVTALLARKCTLVHGDLKLANLGAYAGRVIVLDWGTLTTWAPPAVDHAWYLAINAAAIGRDHADLLDDIRDAQHEPDEVALGLALVGAFAQLGWEKALGATATDARTRERERAGLEWWTTEVRRGLSALTGSD